MSKGNSTRPASDAPAPKRHESRISAIKKHKGASERISDQEVRERYNALMGSPECVFFLDLQGNLIGSNEAARDLLGYQCERDRALNIADILAERQLQEAQAALQETILSGALPELRYLNVQDSDGKWHALSVRASLVFRDNRPHAVMGIARDVTDRNRMRKENEQSRVLNAATQAASSVMHEMKNKLTGVVGYADMILLKLAEGQHHKIGDSARRLLAISHQALNLSVDTMCLAALGKRKSAPVSINLFISDLAACIRKEHAKDSHRFDLDIDLDNDVELLADPDQLEMALENLMINALDAMPDGGTLLLTTEKMEGEVRITISDTGTGIPSEVMETIFEPYVTTKEKGTGLGLAIAWRMIDNHGGKIDVMSEPGQGTTFEITLPCNDETP